MRSRGDMGRPCGPKRTSMAKIRKHGFVVQRLPGHAGSAIDLIIG